MASPDDDVAKKAEDMVKKATDRTTYEALEKDLAAVKNDISALAEQLTEALNSLAGSAGKQARRGYRQARANVDEVLSEASDRGHAVADAAQLAAATIGDTIEDTVRERPLATVAIALGLGFLIGVTWRR
jgi:ElaB/YqjD/DUF883 family membrane-anchored ribosome-binding protein